MEAWSLSELWASAWFAQLGRFSVLLAVATVAYFIARFWIVGLVRRLVSRTETTWDDALVQAEVFVRLAHFAPAIVAFYGVHFIPDLNATLQSIIQRSAIAVMVVVAAL